MDVFFCRQIVLLRRLIDDFRREELSLHSLIQRINGISAAIGVNAWSDAVFPVLLSLEQVSAMTLITKKNLTFTDKAGIEKSLRELEVIAESFVSR